MAQGLIIGYGNRLRGDDGAGWAAARALQRLCRGPAPTILLCRQLTPELAEPVARVPWLLLIDAAQDVEPGHVAVRPLEPSDRGDEPWSHRFGPERLLALARVAGGQAPPALLAAVGGATFEYGVGLSEPTRAAVAELIRWIMARLPGWMHEPTSFAATWRLAPYRIGPGEPGGSMHAAAGGKEAGRASIA